MKIIAAIEADFERHPLGLPVRLEEALRGETVLRRTIRRLLAAERVASVHLVVEAAQAGRARSAVAGLEVAVETHDAGIVPWRDLIASGRKWSLDAWRGGIAGMTVFDEAINPWVLEALGRREGADGVVNVPAAAVLLDPALLDGLLEHFASVRDDVRMAFVQSAPGLAAPVYMPDLLGDLAKIAQPPGRTMAYRPGDPQRDMVMQPCFFSVDPAIMHATGRCLADAASACRRITGLIDALGESGLDAASVSRRLMARRFEEVADLPAEVEIELTTEDPLADSQLRPRGRAVGRRGPMSTGGFERLIEELARRDDIRVVLGGFGDPLMHPEWRRCVETCRRAGIFALAIRTPAVHLDDRAVAVLAENRVDVLNVLLDAHSPGTYRQVHGADHFDRVTANLERVLAGHQRTRKPWPLVVPEMIKTRATLGEMEAFYDAWLSRTGAAVIAGPSAYAGQWPDLGVMQMAPPTRRPCERIFSRAMVLADGRVTVCDQDFRGEHAIGSVAGHCLSDLWTGARMESVRRAHLDAAYDAVPLCPTCDEWHRP